MNIVDSSGWLEYFSDGTNSAYFAVPLQETVKIATKFSIYAYDAFYMQCCLEAKLPLISLDNRMCEVAKSLSIKVVT